jgi:glutaconate CoA-transferase subunit B
MIKMNYSISELMVCVIARELENNDTVAYGLNAELMLAAALLSQKLYAPNLRIRHGLRNERSIELNPPAWTDKTNSIAHKIVEYFETHDEILTTASPNNSNRLCDVFFVGGMQIDKYGNTNLIGIKDEKGKIKIRGPGSIGTSSIAQFVKKYFIFTLEHTKRKFVEEVDFVSTIGYNIRKKYNIKGGPKLCITPLCVFDFENGIMRLKSIHPNSNIEEVIEKTGFKFNMAKNIPITKEPTKEELEFLRKIDKKNVFKEIDKQIII